MANPKLSVEIGAVIANFEKNLKVASRKLEQFAEKNKELGDKMKSVGATASASLTLPLTLLGGVAVANAVKFEKLATSLNVLAGSAEEGEKAFKSLKEYSASTPFQLGDIVRVNNTLLGFGQTTEQAFKSLQMLGDVASVTGADLDRVAVAFGQSAAAGRVMTQDLNQFINNGIPIYDLLGEVTGKNVAELRDLASQGGITFDILNQAFAKATSEGGKFFQGTAKLSQTLGGRLSTLKDNFALASAEAGKLIGDALAPLIELVIKGLKAFQGLSDTTKTVIVVIGALAAAIGPVVATLGFMISNVLPAMAVGLTAVSGGIAKATAVMRSFNLAMLANPIVLVTTAVVALTAAVVSWLQSFTPMVSKWQTFINLVKSGGNVAVFQSLQLADATKAMAEEYATANEASNDYWNAEAEKTLTKEKAAKANNKVAESIKAINRASVSAIPTTTAGATAIPTPTNNDDIVNLPSTEVFDERSAELLLRLQEFNTASEQIIQGGIADTFAGIGEAIGGALVNGTNVLQAAGGALLKGIGDIAVRLGKAAIGIGTSMLAIKLAFKNPFTAIAAGVALVALGSAIGGIANKAINGGGSSGSNYSSGVSGASSSYQSYSGGSSRGSSLASGDGTVVFEIAGTKLVGVLERTLRQNRSLAGTINLTT